MAASMAHQADSSRPDIPNKLTGSSKSTEGDPSWHKTSTLVDGTRIGRLGAYWYILDEDGHAISDGYHEIILDEKGDYKGQRSARSEQIVLYGEPNQVSSNGY